MPDADPVTELSDRLAATGYIADRPLAQAQKFCPVQKSLLGTMGKPDRIEIDGQPVFLCCAACADDARADPNKTLKQVALFKKDH